MKIQNTITQPQLEMLLRLANAMHSGNPAWRYGQSIANAISLMLPALSAEINGNSEVDPFHWPEDYGARWTQWYATLCPDEPREKETDKRIVCFMCAEYADITEEHDPFCDKCAEYLNERDEKLLDLTNSFTKKHK